MLSVREMQQSDIDSIAKYWCSSDTSYFLSLGVDVNKIPTHNQLSQMLTEQLKKPIEQRNSYCIIWELGGTSIGHSNTNPTVFCEEAYMHLHLWNQEVRKKGLGTALLKMTLPLFFERLQLKKLYCEPYALNSAPNKTLENIGFEFVREYITIPGSLNFEQPVKRWELSYEKFQLLK